MRQRRDPVHLQQKSVNHREKRTFRNEVNSGEVESVVQGGVPAKPSSIPLLLSFLCRIPHPPSVIYLLSESPSSFIFKLAFSYQQRNNKFLLFCETKTPLRIAKKICPLAAAKERKATPRTTLSSKNPFFLQKPHKNQIRAPNRLKSRFLFP
ncbi:uncharacterized protein LAJ45_00602 [Morchella importuna]|uniref:uncharacterized protein n=1 Tax=Morchella importuna TaxID=1174673 RepID=UPI001E8DD1B9|nr:uncharacterized protein LAJ45_00602 [Morchella importuna]KAH8155592.1 hypothetical protein LAJ45_00602 [Morchella importuna]